MSPLPPPPPPRRWLRAVVALAYAATVLITWRVWQHRASPPMLPLLPLPSVSVGAAMLATIAWAALRPREGTVAHALVLAYAVATDELRAQPYVLSLALLQWGASSSGPGLTLARAHLVSLWLWGGLHKAASPAFFHTTAPWLWTGVPSRALRGFAPHFGYAVVATELGLAALALVPRTRRVAAALAVVTHLGILALISRPSLGRNVALWPWNLCLAAAAVGLLAPWREAWRETLRREARPVLAAAALLLVAPAGYEAGVIGPTLAHVLYTGAVPETVRCSADGRCDADAERRETIRDLRVMIPPEPRLQRRYFRATCRAGDRLMLHDPRRDDDEGPQVEEIRCPRQAP